ncbi:hypothetical protein AYL99_05297 [Fonsecaea erecta]|uniref:DUF7587 domain-containing protein n=1 Tax=Fonsecaea erecta TaxID=1367422 RepID=A0A178ZMN9_9EURO|nr:hypothetical protein AYL99_05297 [Fonsecaea erecta]OAP60295.1 hypothetical protein AYL99_05297 [Fonsecaea erecta]
MAVLPLIHHPIPTLLRELPDPAPLPAYLFFTSHSGSATQVSPEGIFCGSWARPGAHFLKQWVHDTPEQHFANHFDKDSLYPTMFISTTPEFLRAVQIAVRHYRYGRHGIKITVIDVEKARQSYHDITNARDIVRRLNWDEEDAVKFKSEWLFLGRVKACAIVHQIDLDARFFEFLCRLFPTFNNELYLRELRSNIAKDFCISNPYPYEQPNQGKDDAEKCATLANRLGPWMREKGDVYEVIVRQIRSWKDDMMEAEIEADVEYRRDFQDTFNSWVHPVFW